MTWKSISEEDVALGNILIKWIEIVRKEQNIKEWLPSDADFYKSALFERLRNGLAPLKFPPPIGFACPWYALVEDKGPHYVGPDFWLNFTEDTIIGPNVSSDLAKFVSILQNPYKVEDKKDNYFILSDAYHITLYRFKLWYDKTYTINSNSHLKPGAWLIQNVEFS